MKYTMILIIAILVMTGNAWPDGMMIDIRAINKTGIGSSIGTITVTSSPYGSIFTPALINLTPGLHGFHVHENPDCSTAVKGGKTVPGLAAGGHYDPVGTGRHAGPYGDGHLGDLPPLFTDQDGRSTLPVLAPRINLSDLKGRSLIIHAGTDNYSDIPKALGGGGARIACGVVK